MLAVDVCTLCMGTGVFALDDEVVNGESEEPVENQGTTLTATIEDSSSLVNDVIDAVLDPEATAFVVGKDANLSVVDAADLDWEISVTPTVKPVVVNPTVIRTTIPILFRIQLPLIINRFKQ